MAFSILRYLLHIFVAAVYGVLFVFRWLITILSTCRPKTTMDKAVDTISSQFFPWMSVVYGDPNKMLSLLNKRRQEMLNELPIGEDAENVSETTVAEWICLLKARDGAFREILIQDAKKTLNETVFNMLMPLRELRKLLSMDDWMQYRTLVLELKQVLPSEELQQFVRTSHSVPLGHDFADRPSRHGHELALTQPESDGSVLAAKNLPDRKFPKKLEFDLTEPRSDGSVLHQTMCPDEKSRKQKSRMLPASVERRAVVSPLRKSVKSVGVSGEVGFESLKDPLCDFHGSADKAFKNGLNGHVSSATSDLCYSTMMEENKCYREPVAYGLFRDVNVNEGNEAFLPGDDFDGNWEPLAVSTPLEKARHSHAVMENLACDRIQKLPEEVNFQTLARCLGNMSKTCSELSDSMDENNDSCEIRPPNDAEYLPGLPSFEHPSISSGIMSFNGDAKSFLKGRTVRAFSIPAYLQPITAAVIEEEMMLDHSHHNDSVD